MILAGDIGGTKTILALFSREGGPHQPLAEAVFPSSGYDSLEAVVREFLAANPVIVEAACFGVAGPVVAGRAEITNLPWVIDIAQIRVALGSSKILLLNDLEAIAYALPVLEADDIATLNPGERVAGGALAVIAPGTGLGEAFLTWDGARYRAHPSEGGHCSFAPNSPAEIALLQYLQERLGHVSFERVCSGIGIPNIYAYFRDQVFGYETPAVAERLRGAADPTPVIVSAAVDPAAPCPVAAATLEAFVRILGAEAGNLALKVLATGGVFIGGGIPPRILAALRAEGFLASFSDKGRFGELLARVPVHVILNSKAALLGAANAALS
jgi:glucokinase